MHSTQINRSDSEEHTGVESVLHLGRHHVGHGAELAGAGRVQAGHPN